MLLYINLTPEEALRVLLHEWGAAVLSDDNPYLREIYRDREQIYFYHSSNTDAIPEQIKSILSDQEQLYHTMLGGGAGKRIYDLGGFSGSAVGDFTWRKR